MAVQQLNPYEPQGQDSIRHVRMERKAKTAIIADDGSSWAVSYSDMLMVLMSFFILFFSFDDGDRAGLVSKIALEMQSKAGSKKIEKIQSQRANTKSDSKEEMAASASDIAQIAAGLRGLGLEVKADPQAEEVTINLSDQIYASRRFDMNERVEKELASILKTLAPYKGQLRLVIIGHSDRSPVSKPEGYLNNNQDLSSLRAAKALNFVLGQGFKSDQISIQGAASQQRNSRSLSLKIMPTD